MGNLHWRRVASGIALIIATLALVLLHKLNYSREHQFFVPQQQRTAPGRTLVVDGSSPDLGLDVNNCDEWLLVKRGNRVVE
jgi:hypothetical protein